MSGDADDKRLRSSHWFDDPNDPTSTAHYVERYLNQSFTRKEITGGKPIIGISQTGSDLSPCNKIHVLLAARVREGIRDAGGVPMEFPIHPIQETGKRPTAALDRNLAYLSLVEVLNGYPIDGVVLTTGCDKTTPAQLMGAATVDIPAIVLSGGPMLDGWWRDRMVGAGTIVWECRRRFAIGEIDADEFMNEVCASAASLGHCNTMGTASTMNTLAEVLGMSLPGCAAIPAPHADRAAMAYETGKRIVQMVREDLKPSKIISRESLENAIRVNTAIGGSTNAPPHITAIARHIGLNLPIEDWQRLGFDVPLILDMQPAGRFLAESYYRAGGAPVVMAELLGAGLLHGGALTCTGKTVAENLKGVVNKDPEVIRPIDNPMREKAGFLIISGNLFDSALMKTSVISPDFQERFLSRPGAEGVFEARAVVFEGPEDYHERINDSELGIDEESMLFIRNVGPIGYPGSGEVVNMQPPDALLKAGINHLPTVGDGRQSGTSESPSILNASPEALAGGGLAILKTGDRVRLDLNAGKLDMLVPEGEIKARWDAYQPPDVDNQTPWQELFRNHVGQLDTGMCLDFATRYHDTARVTPRHSH